MNDINCPSSYIKTKSEIKLDDILYLTKYT